MMIATAFAALFAYLAGAVPFSYIAGRVAGGIDIRSHGSGNAGASNTARVMGKKAGILVLLLDFAKGSAAVYLAPVIAGFFSSSAADPGAGAEISRLIATAAAVTGHVFPVYIGFRGGKGVATAAGCVTVLYPPAFFLCLAVFASVFYFTRIPSAASLSAVWSLPMLYPLVSGFLPPFDFSFEILFIFCALLITFTHRGNIVRLLRKNENRIDF